MKTASDRGSVLVVAPLGKDAALAVDALVKEGIAARVCTNLSDLTQETNDDTEALVIAREALDPAELPALLHLLSQQPAWSDLPIIVLTSSNPDSERLGVRAVDVFGPSGNVTLLERPLGAVTLLSTVRVARRARHKQWEVRDLIAQRETILSSITDALSALDRDWRYVFVNDRVASLSGRTKEELIGRCIWEIFPDAVGGEFYLRCQRAMGEQEPQHFELFYEPWQRWLETHIYPSPDGITILRSDITDQKKAAALLRERDFKLEESEARLRLAIEAADIGTFDYYPGTAQLQCSARCNELFGMAPDQPVTYETYLSAVHPEDRHLVLRAVESVRQPANAGRYNIEYRTIGIGDRKERWISERGRVVLDGEGGGATRFVGTLVDISDRKRAELEASRARKAAEDANTTKDQFLAMLSHELRTPLTPVLMTVAALQRDVSLSDEVQSDLQLIHRNVELEALIIDDLLDLTRITHGKLELHNDAVDVHGLLEHALSITAAEVEEKNLTVIQDFQAREHHSWADAARLQQVFWNLVKNAVKFTSSGGRIELRTRNDSAHHLIVEVADNGIGIEPDLMPRIFNAFEQGGRRITSRYGGLGLGLAISRSVVELHHGKLEVSSAGRGHGSTFTTTLNAIATSLLNGPVYEVDRPHRGSTARRLLLVEDHQDTARVLRRILESAGYTVAVAHDLGAARQLADAQPFDLVISDVGLPDGTGLELMRHLRDKHQLVGIALSGFGTDEDLAASAEAGFAEHLIKPVDWERLKVAIERLVSDAPPAA